MSAVPPLPVDKFGYRPELLEPLRWAMNPANLRQPLAAAWPEWEPLLGGLELERVHPRGGRGFLLEYRLDQRVLYAELMGADAAEYAARVNSQLRRLPVRQCDESQPLRLLTDPGVVIRTPGIDHRLPLLGVINRPDQAEPSLATVLGAGTRILSTELLAHRLGRRAVVRLRYLNADNAQPRSLILKCYKARNARYQKVFAWMQHLDRVGLGDGDRTRVVKPYHSLAGDSALLMEDVPGIALDQLRGAALTAGVHDAGIVLRQLQRQPLVLDQQHSHGDELAVLTRWVPLTAALFPSLATPLQRCWDKVRRGLERLDEDAWVVSHRDYYDKQLIVGNAGTVLLDLDTLCRADPALDIGNFLAHLQLLELQQRGAAAPLWRAFHAGLGDRPRARPHAITLYRMATLLRLACLHAFWSRWHGLAKPLLEACDGA